MFLPLSTFPLFVRNSDHKLGAHLLFVQEQEIVELKEKMEDMAVEFGEMLKDTLDKMSERIEATASEWNASSADDGNVQKKLDELSLH